MLLGPIDAQGCFIFKGMVLMRALKEVARDWLPPVLVRWLRRIRGMGVSFEGEFSTWEEARAHCTGYDGEVILARVLAQHSKLSMGRRRLSVTRCYLTRSNMNGQCLRS